MPPTIDPKVLAVVERVLASKCSIVSAVRAEFICFTDTKSEDAFCRNVRRHVQNRRDADKAEAEAGTTKHYAKAAEQAAKAAQLAAGAAGAAAKSAAASSKKVTVKELTGKKMTRGQASGKKQLDKQKKRVRVEAFKTACVQFAEVKESGGLTSQQVCDWVGYQMCLSPASKPKPGTVRKQVAVGLAGVSPGKRGRKFKVGASLLEAVSLRLSISQANGAEFGGREILQTLKAATVGTALDAEIRNQQVNGWLMKRFRDHVAEDLTPGRRERTEAARFDWAVYKSYEEWFEGWRKFVLKVGFANHRPFNHGHEQEAFHGLAAHLQHQKTPHKGARGSSNRAKSLFFCCTPNPIADPRITSYVSTPHARRGAFQIDRACPQGPQATRRWFCCLLWAWCAPRGSILVPCAK